VRARECCVLESSHDERSIKFDLLARGPQVNKNKLLVEELSQLLPQARQSLTPGKIRVCENGARMYVSSPSTKLPSLFACHLCPDQLAAVSCCQAFSPCLPCLRLPSIHSVPLCTATFWRRRCAPKPSSPLWRSSESTCGTCSGSATSIKWVKRFWRKLSNIVHVL